MSGQRRESRRRREHGLSGPRRPLPRGWPVTALLAALASLLPLGGAAQAAGPVDWPAVQLAEAAPPAPNAERGFVVACDGDLAALGARFDGPHGEGVVYVFTRLGTQWSEVLQIIGHAAGDQLGISLAVHGNTIAAGAAREERGQERPQGTVYLFHLFFSEVAVNRETTVSRTEEIVDLPAGSTIGRALALDDTQLAVSATVHGAAGDDGVVQVHPLPLVEGDPGESVVPVGRQQGDRFGETLVLNGGQLIVGAPGHSDHPLQPTAGAVFRFAPNPGPSPGWRQLEMLRAPNPAPNAEFGAALAASGSAVVVGAPGANAEPAAGGASPGGAGGKRGPGAVYVFACDDSVCTPQAELTPAAAADNERFGQSVSVSGGLLIGGAPLHAAGAPATGAAYAFNLQQDGAGNNVWIELGELPGSGTVPNALFGFTVAQTPDTVFVGAPLAAGRVGSVAALTPPPVPVPLASRRHQAADRRWLDFTPSGRGAASP
jgi:hypothetical protein